MTPTTLHIATAADAPETVSAKVRRLQAEVKALSKDQVAVMHATVLRGVEAAREVAMNPAQPEGIRQLAQQLARDGDSLLLTLAQIVGRAA